MPEFELWLEFEQWIPKGDEDPENDYFNMLVKLSDGRKYGLNVWTFKALESARQESIQFGEPLGGRYLLPPDLFVERLDRSLMEEVVADLIALHALKDEWLAKEVEYDDDN